MEDQAGLRCVVMGDQHDRVPRVRRADLGHDVVGVVRRQDAPGVVLAARDVVPHSGCGGTSERGPGEPAPLADQPTERPSRRQHHQRPPVVAVHARGLDVGVGTVLAHPAQDPLRRLALPGRRRGPVDRGQLRDLPTQPLDRRRRDALGDRAHAGLSAYPA
jgi:hypothetical protein